VAVQRGINDAAEVACSAITDMAQKCKGKDDYKKVATVSANHDACSATSSPRRFTRSAPTASSKWKKARATRPRSTMSKACQFDKGYISPYFMTDPKTAECVIENPYILLYEKKIANLTDLLRSSTRSPWPRSRS
jgi:chaperonin GroEL